LTYTCTAEFPLQGLIIYGTACNNLAFVLGQASPCEPLVLQWDPEPNFDVWLWVGPSIFTGVPESDYLLEVCGILPEPSREGACCTAGSCQITNSVFCEFYYNGEWGGPGVPCTPIPCGETGACCLPDGSCAVAPMSECNHLGGEWLFPIANCEPDPCGPVPVEETSWGRIKSRYR
jgi:hypothetical protein